ncbi:Cytochrome c oxidase subunit 3 [Posidoniimonas polymericola]|uniref:Cytochrome c oxidase subunit 3 n=1 Tax=Posidoniimonas polymericola TaxID=2528002 RepID=A0A5C5YTR5_9BACT|nr:cytochrome c oxidase subunit 3 [Posidoniimonas polymericola]TWT78201.1 Cytochrome c oxidase subunit 3 [Posidoniimonas polymericola]
MATAEAPTHDAHGHDHDHPEWLAHHFESPEQQFEAGKLGMWLFLAQEVLFFSGLFVAYTVYRANHPEVFIQAHHFLNPWLGMLNTIVLLASSLAIAWGVRAAQKNQQQTLLWMHIFTLACAGFFMGVKVVEYSYKFDEGLFWAGHDREYGLWNEGLELDANGEAIPKFHLTDEGLHTGLQGVMVGSFIIGGLMYAYGWLRRYASPVRAWIFVGLGLTIIGMGGGVVVANGVQQIEVDKHAAAGHGEHAEGGHSEAGHSEAGHSEAGHSDIPTFADDVEQGGAHADHAVAGAVAEGDQMQSVDREAALTPPAQMGGVGIEETRELVPISTAGRPANAGNFFSIYFAMTGVHALHILAGVAAISWIIGRIARGDFGPERYGPVEYVGLYWHLVDLVWIYLFPLLYLIH